VLTDVGAGFKPAPTKTIMTFDPDIHHRRSIRLKEYDYSQPGAYFVTVCTHNRECLFGHIQENVMVMNDAGRMIEKWWQELPRKYPIVDMDAYTVMPNHFHGIVSIVGAVSRDHIEPFSRCCVGAALRGRPEELTTKDRGQPHRVAPTLGDMINWFKTMTTNDYIRGKHNQWRPFPGKLWQRNYYEHVIWDEHDLNEVREYITNNPAGWDRDDDNPAFVGAGFKPAPTPLI